MRYKSSHFNVLSWRICTVILKLKTVIGLQHYLTHIPLLILTTSSRKVGEFAPLAQRLRSLQPLLCPQMAVAAADLGPSQLWNRGLLHIESWRYADRLLDDYLTLKRLHQRLSRWRESISVLTSVLMAPFAKIPVT